VIFYPILNQVKHISLTIISQAGIIHTIMVTRRRFLQSSVLGLSGLTYGRGALSLAARPDDYSAATGDPVPVVVSTWPHGLEANKAALEVLSGGGSSLDAVEKGVMVPEADPLVTSVGYGGLPDAGGDVTLDACIMDEKGNCGSVAYLKHIMHPVCVARLVMEKTPHVMLAGQGALDFALEQGFREEDLLTDRARQAWEHWKPGREESTEPWQGHDTIGMLAIDNTGNMAGACTTSGLAFKKPGRVGDSPIIGAGLFVDNEVGGAVATGTGELVMKTLGTFLVVELMRGGMEPGKACEEAVSRIIRRYAPGPDKQVGYLALSKAGKAGACSIRGGFSFAEGRGQENSMHWSDFIIED
jgi:N4-(beta-N-acetylglucosaminyl)-L-asparaginase